MKQKPITIKEIEAVADEFAWFKAQTMTKMPRLLVLLDY